MENIKEKKADSDYKLIDLLKFICAFLVIGIHTRPFQTSSNLLDKFFYYDISNYAVPFFYACTGYFLIAKSSNENMHAKLIFRCKKILRIYLMWSAIYLPLTISGWIIEGGLNPAYLIQCLRNFVFVGDNFYSWTLWYLNGLIFALLLIDILLRKFSVKQIANIGAFVYLIGIGLTMLNGHLESLPLFLEKPIELYVSLFVTTRNGLFQSLVFVAFGMLIAEIEHADGLNLSIKKGLLTSCIYMVKVGVSLIGGGQYFSKMLDLPTFYFLFELVIYACKIVNFRGSFYKQLRGMSETIYFVHMYFVAFCSLVLYKGNYHNFKSYFICAGGATIIALLRQIYKNKKEVTKMAKYFGTDGFRGEAGITLTADHAYKVGRFLGWYYNALRERNGDTKPARIVIGKDTRRSSYMFEYSLVAGLTASGADAYLLHVTTTPSVAYIARVDDFDCGIMISASHNPYYDNGIKLIDCYGEKMPEETLLLVEDYIDGKLHVFDKDWPELPFAHREHIGCTVDYVAGRNRYMGYLISLGIYSFKGVKVGLDCANGSSWNIAKSVFDALGADTYVINNKPNGLNINNNAGSTHIEGLQKFVVEKGLDVGFAFDGDADRCLCVDEKGNVITGDHILYIYGCYMKERGKLLNNTVVTTVMSNFGLYKAFDEQGIGYAKTAVGDKYVYEYMAKNSCRIGGEQSGHIIFSKYASTGDGILTSLKMMEVMLAKKKPMSELAAPLKIYPQVLENVRVTDKKAAQNDPAVQEAVNTVAEVLGNTGRILVRESGTEPVVRVMVEAPDHDTCQKYVDEVVNVICEKGYKA